MNICFSLERAVLIVVLIIFFMRIEFNLEVYKIVSIFFLLAFKGKYNISCSNLRLLTHLP